MYRHPVKEDGSQDDTILFYDNFYGHAHPKFVEISHYRQSFSHAYLYYLTDDMAHLTQGPLYC